MQNTLELSGHPASDGVFAGPVTYLNTLNMSRENSGVIAVETQVLRHALNVAVAELEALSLRGHKDETHVTTIQIALLADPELSILAFEKILLGEAADVAWLECMNRHIAEYLASDEEYFRARASDLKDMRDRILSHIVEGPKDHPKLQQTTASVYFGEDIAPTFFLETDWSRGGAIALTGGSPLSHVAMLARARGVPMVVGLGVIADNSHQHAVVDGGRGAVIFDSREAVQKNYAASLGSIEIRNEKKLAYLHAPAVRKDGSPIELLINISSIEELALLDPETCDGVGLLRSEFLYMQSPTLPDEEYQYNRYCELAEWAKGKPVTIRTLDLGGDKIVKGLTPVGEGNPFLGLRGIRLALARKDIFRTQLRALARVAAIAPIKIMLPMVSDPQEIVETRMLLNECMAELSAENIANAKPSLGIMVEVPAVAIAPELFMDADFFSVGSNDLTQYVTAISRDSGSVSLINNSVHPAVLKLIKGVVAFAQAKNIPVSICGDIASDEHALKHVLDCGLKSISVAPSRIARIKAALREL
jgi:phosphoenolpyruvate-protein phosphotransferase (PTS system enzyme I)